MLMVHHYFQMIQEWPLLCDVTMTYLAPTLRPPDMPPHKTSRPNLLYRIVRRLRNYWNPPPEGIVSCGCADDWVSREHSLLINVSAEPPKEEPEQWEEQKRSSLELYIQTHNKNPVERVSITC